MARLTPHARAVKTLNPEQSQMLSKLTELFDPTLPINKQSVEYLDLAKAFNSTLNADQLCLTRVTCIWSIN